MTDRIKQHDGNYVDGSTMGHNVSVSGSEAVNLVSAAEAFGNTRVTFSDRCRATAYMGEGGTRCATSSCPESGLASTSYRRRAARSDTSATNS